MSRALAAMKQSVRRHWPVAVMVLGCAMMLAAVALAATPAFAEETPSAPSDPAADGAAANPRAAAPEAAVLVVRLDGAPDAEDDALAARLAQSRSGAGFVDGAVVRLFVDDAAVEPRADHAGAGERAVARDAAGSPEPR